MIALLTDHNFNRSILRGLIRHLPDLDVLRTQDLGLGRLPDPDLLEWAAQDNRVILTHDASTMKDFAYERVTRGQRMPGVIIVRATLPVGQAVEELLVILQACRDNEFENQVHYVPIS